MPLAARRHTCLVLALACALVLPCGATAEEAKPKAERLHGFDLELDLWAVSGVETAAEAYESQLTLVLKPSYALGEQLFHGSWLSPLKLGMRLLLTSEFSGNDPSFRGSHFASPALFGELPSSAASLQADTQGASTPSGQVEGATRRVDVSDLWFTLSHDNLWELPKTGIRVIGDVRFVFPTSYQSRNAGLYFSPSLDLGLARKLGPVELSFDVRAVRYFFAYADAPLPHDGGDVYVNGMKADVYQPDFTGSPNPEFSFVYTLDAELSLPHDFSASIMYALFDVWTYAPSTCSVPGVATADVCRDGPEVGGVQRPGRHDNGWFLAELDWKPRPWTTLGIGLSTYQPVRMPDGTIANPFWHVSRDNLTTIYLSLGVTAEALAQAFGKKP